MKIVLIGAGNLATRLGLHFKACGMNMLQVYSRTLAAAMCLAEQLDCLYTHVPGDVTAEADLYVVAINDKAFHDVLPKINFGNKLVVHTAGSIDIQILSDYAVNYGVFYPLQTFSKVREVDFFSVPICIEANSKENGRVLEELAKKVSHDVRYFSSKQRRQIHLSAVFVCNFVNHLYTIGGELLNEEGISFDILHPLIHETAIKAMAHDPKNVQTGPAVRYDRNVIEHHIEMLKNHPEWGNLYKDLSSSIHHLYQ